MAAIDQLIEDLRGEGSLDSEGRFTLDREQARAKLQKFQLVDARRYVLELVQAAILRDASTIKFEIDADDMRMRFDGLAFTPAELDDLYGSLFRDGNDRPLRGVRQLALALNAAVGMEPKRIVLRSGEVELRVAPGAPDEIVTRERRFAGTEIHVRQRFGVRVLVDYFKDLLGRVAEEGYLAERCVYATIPIELDGRRLSSGLAAGEPGLASLGVQSGSFRGVMKVVGRAQHCELRLVKDGVWIDTRELRSCGSHLQVVVEGEELRKDVSQAKIVADEALERIEAAIRTARWQLWRKAQAELGDAIAELVREQLLEHATREELTQIPAARELAAHVTWPDCRDRARRISLAELAELVAADETLRFARRPFPELPYADPPIILVEGLADVAALERLLDSMLVVADDLLARERRRMLGRRAWREREAELRLPSHIRYATSGTIVVSHELGQFRGEIGVDVQALTDPDLRAPVHLFMSKDGCLLGRAELDLDLPSLWIALAAEFEPNDDYTDAVRDQTFIHALLHALASLRGPFAGLLAAVADHPSEPVVRGMIKRWLIALLDRKAQLALLTAAGADLAPQFYVAPAQLLPGLSEASEPLARAPLFEALEGPRLSLATVAERLAAGELRYCEGRPKDPRLTEPDVVFLGPGDRKIIRALFGDDRLVRWDPGAKQRELEFWDKPEREFADLRAGAGHLIRGHGLDPDRWIVDLPEGPTRGFVCLDYEQQADDDVDELGELALHVHLRGRELCTVELRGELGPITAVIDHPKLRASASWDDVVRDAAFDEALAAVRTASAELVRRVSATFDELDGAPRRWLARVLVHVAAHQPALREAVAELPILATIDGAALSLAQAQALVRERGRLQWAPRELGPAPISDPPIIALDDELDDLSALFEGALDDASERVRHHRVFDRIASKPRLDEAKLDPERTLVRLELRGEAQVGEIGLSSRRSSPALELTLGTAGREISRARVETAFFVPVDAIVLDEQLPLDEQGNADVRSKRLRNLVRQIRRRVPSLTVALCERWPALRGDERELAWTILLGLLRREANQQRSEARQGAFELAADVAWFRDVCGRRCGLAEILRRAGSRPVDVLAEPRHAEVRVDVDGLERTILIVSAEELECVEAHTQVRRLDAVWQDELAAIRALASAPKLDRPKLDEVALVSRKAMVAGGLECELWIAREPSLLAGEPPTLVFARANRKIGDGRINAALPAHGIVHGAGLEQLGGEVLLDERQSASLERQLLILYVDLARLVERGRMSKRDHEVALEHLAWAAHHLRRESDALRNHGKHLGSLRSALDELVSPALREAVGRRLSPKPEPEPDPQPEPELEPEPEPEPEAAPALEPAQPAPPAFAEPSAEPSRDPGQRLLAAVYEQLHWARARHHDLLDELLLNRMRLRGWGRGEVALVDRSALLLNRDHPIVTRLLGQDRFDPIDLSFLIAAIYTVLNYEADEISDDDEREFVAQFAEALALAGRVGSD